MTTAIVRAPAPKTIGEALASPTIQKAIQERLPKHIPASRFIRLALGLAQNPDLAACTMQSFLGALYQASALGLEPNVLGQCYLIPYGKTATLVVGYRGYITLAYQSGSIKSIHAKVVRAGDEFEWHEGTEARIVHVPHAEPDMMEMPDPSSPGSNRRIQVASGKNVTYIYAICELISGGRLQHVMTRKEVDAIRSRSRAGHSGPWVTDYEQMAAKTAIRQLVKLMPLSTQLRPFHDAANLDEHTDAGLDQPLVLDASEFAVAATGTENGDTPQEQGSTPPSEGISPSVEVCPLHNIPWRQGNYGPYHPVPGKGLCNPGKAGPEMADAAGVDRPTLNAWLKEGYNMTASKIGPEILVDLYYWLQSRKEAMQDAISNPEPRPATPSATTQPGVAQDGQAG